MGGCFGFSLLKLKLKHTRRFLRSRGLETKLIDIDNGSTMHCWVPVTQKNSEDIGSDPGPRPALLLIHGFGADGMISWENQIASLVKHFSLYLPDLLFFGESTTENKQRSEFFQAECMWKMLQKLGVQEALVAGHSYGGFVAFRMAHEYPEFVKRLVIVSSGVCMNPQANDGILKKFGATKIEEILVPDTVEGTRKAMNLVCYKLPWLPDFVYRDMMETMGGDREGKLELVDGLVLGKENAPPLPTVEQDVLIIWGDKDEIFNIELAHQLKQHLGNKAELVIIEGVGHVPTIEKPREFNRALVSFLIES